MTVKMLDAVAIIAESDEIIVSKSYAGGTDVFAYYLDQVEKMGNRNEVGHRSTRKSNSDES